MKEKREALFLTEQREKKWNRVSAALLWMTGAAGIAVGMTGIFFELGGTPAFLIPVSVAAISTVLAYGLNAAAKGRSYGSILCLCVAAGLFFWFTSSVIRGIHVWCNHFLGVWNGMFGTFYEEFSASGYVESDTGTMGMVLAFLCAATACELVRRRRFMLLTLLVFFPLCLCLALNVRLSVWIAAVLMAGWMAVWCGTSGPEGIRWETAVLVVGMGAALYFLPVAGSGILWKEAADGFQTDIRQGIRTFRFGEDSLPEGDMAKADRMLAGTEERLELRMEKPSPVYLRGFVGSEYEGNEWKAFDAEVYGGEFSGMLSWFAGYGFCPGAQYADYRNASPEPGWDGEEAAVSVRNVGANRRYVYLPETVSLYPGNAGNWKQDWSMEASGWFGERKYDFVFYDIQEYAEIQAPEAWIYQETKDTGETGRFRQAELVYRSFVYENYLTLDEEQEELMDAVFFQGDTEKGAEGLYAVTSRIRAVLRILADYKEIPAQVPDDKEFLDWFLKEGKEGNAAYYATAAVMAYRAAGIPARYVEGYVLTKKQAERMEDGTAVLSEKNAHAWVEVYVDGMGWRTVEITPGFYEELYPTDVVIAVPSEDVGGVNEEMGGIQASEEYEFQEAEEELQVLPEKRIRTVRLPALLILAAVMLAADLCFIRIFYLKRRYRNMTGKERMYLLYGLVMGMMRKLYKGFNPEHPLELQEQGDTPFDRALYVRTVKRMEKIIYGQAEPAAREIPATEALVRQLRAALRGKRKSRDKNNFS